MIQASNISKSVSSTQGVLTILRSVSLDVKPGQTLALLGMSGSGKSTLLSLLAGLDVCSSGEIKIAGKDITRMDEEDRAALRREMIGFVFQSFLLVPGLSALENVMLPLELQENPLSQAEIRSKAQEMLARVQLSDRATHTPSQLSGGEQQRVAIARAFVSQPKLLFADEPTGNLDSQTGAHITDLLFQMNKDTGTTLILVTHDESLAKRCQRRLYLRQGELTESSELEQTA